MWHLSSVSFFCHQESPPSLYWLLCFYALSAFLSHRPIGPLSWKWVNMGSLTCATTFTRAEHTKARQKVTCVYKCWFERTEKRPFTMTRPGVELWPQDLTPRALATRPRPLRMSSYANVPSVNTRAAQKISDNTKAQTISDNTEAQKIAIHCMGRSEIIQKLRRSEIIQKLRR